MQDPFKSPDKRCSVYCTEFWEFEDGFTECHPEVFNAQNVLALSDFNRDVFRKLLPNSIRVTKLLYPFQFVHGKLASIKETRIKYGIGPCDFTIFFNFDYASSYFRKNPEGILQAFSVSLKGKNNTKVVFKTMRAKKCKAMSDRLHSLADKLGIATNLITIDDFIPQEDLVNLTNACDVYMSLHRGEGFGLGIAEAMPLGKPVIVTDYSSTTEFCKADNAMLVPYKMVKIHKDQLDHESYKNVTMWAEPDCDAAAEALLRLYNDKGLRTTLGNSAKRFIDAYFSIKNFRCSIDAFLDGDQTT